jgi:hypothetical protein
MLLLLLLLLSSAVADVLAIPKAELVALVRQNCKRFFGLHDQSELQATSSSTCTTTTDDSTAPSESSLHSPPSTDTDTNATTTDDAASTPTEQDAPTDRYSNTLLLHTLFLPLTHTHTYLVCIVFHAPADHDVAEPNKSNMRARCVARF